MSMYGPAIPLPPMNLNPLQGGIGALNGVPNGLLQRGLGGAFSPAGVPSVLPGAPGLLAEAAPVASTARGAMGALGPAASQAGQAAGGARGLASGLLGRLPSVGGGSAGGEGLMARGAGLLANPASHPFMRLGVGTTVGLIGSNLVDRLNVGGNQSNWEQGLQGAAVGAGTGAAVGSIFPVIGTGIGAAVGGVAGGAIGIVANMFGGGGDDGEDMDPRAILGNAIGVAGLDPVATEEIMTSYATLMALAESYPEDSDERKEAEQMAYEQSAQMVLGALATKEQAGMQAGNALAMQGQAAQIFEPLAQDIEMSNALYAKTMAGIRDSLPAEYQAVADATVAREMSSGSNLADAYRAQAQLMPIYNQMTQYQRDQDNYAAQMFSQALAQQAAGGGTQVGASQADVLAALQPTG